MYRTLGYYNDIWMVAQDSAVTTSGRLSPVR